MSVVKQYTRAYWNSSNPVLPLDIAGIEIETMRVKYGDGVTPWKELPFCGLKFISKHIEAEKHSDGLCFNFDYGSFLTPNTNTPIDAGSFTSPAVNFFLDLCFF
jgi:hypothetical protein